MIIVFVFFVGVHHILDAAEQLIQRYQCKIQILIGGKVSWNDPYSAYCGHKMDFLRHKYPFSVWANPNDFFCDGPLVNLGADVALMPSKFEPGGIVQHEFFIAGTPVLGKKSRLDVVFVVFKIIIWIFRFLGHVLFVYFLTATFISVHRLKRVVL